MSSELSGARGRDHSGEAGRLSADQARAGADYQERRETEAYDKRHAEQTQEREAANKAAAMFSPVGHVPLTREPGNTVASDAAAGHPAAAGQEGSGRAGITHYYVDYGGHHLYLYTDGKRWAGGYDLARERSPEDTRSSRGDPTQIPRTIGEYLSTGERVAGIPVVGKKPDRSPGDTSDLPPSGEKLLEAETGKLSRLERLRRRAEDPEIAGDMTDAAGQQTSTAEQILAARHPHGHTVQTSRDSPNASVPTADHASVADMASTGVVITILLVEAGRALRDMLRHRKER